MNVTQTVCNNQDRVFSLEKEFSEHHIREVDIEQDCGFRDYLDPNERKPEGIAEHLERSDDGVRVTTGTERGFFNLLSGGKCKGLVFRDINPKVKAYVDFNTMLIRVSETREEYNRLTVASVMR